MLAGFLDNPIDKSLHLRFWRGRRGRDKVDRLNPVLDGTQWTNQPTRANNVQAATTEIKEGENPARWHRVFWAFILGLLPVFMMFVGGLDIIRSGVLVASLPMLAVSIAIVFALMKSLREHQST